MDGNSTAAYRNLEDPTSVRNFTQVLHFFNWLLNPTYLAYFKILLYLNLLYLFFYYWSGTNTLAGGVHFITNILTHFVVTRQKEKNP